MTNRCRRAFTVPFLVALALADANAATGGKAVCHDAETYRAIVRDRSGEVGSDILLRAIKPGPRAACAYKVRPGDKVATSARDAATFLWLRGGYLALDLGTGPDRTLRIQDVSNGGRVFDALYVDTPSPVAPGRPDGAFTFWRIDAPVQAVTCPAEWRRDPAHAEQKSAHATSEMRFDLAARAIAATGQKGCTLTQGDIDG